MSTDWFERVDCPSDRRERALQMLRDIPREIRDVYRPYTHEGRLQMRTPQCVLVATLDAWTTADASAERART